MAPQATPVYLDNNATTRLDPAVIDAMRLWWDEQFGNASSGDHALGWQASQAVEAAREQIATLIAADAHEIVFTSGATESNNLALLGAARGHKQKRDHIVVSAVEHKCVLEAAHHLRQSGWHTDIAPVDAAGRVRLDALEHLVTERTLLVAVMAVNNEIGTLQPIEEVGRICEKVGALYHVDAAQASSALNIDVFESNISLLSLSGHKMYGPNGIGALFVRSDIRESLIPLQFGGGQENGLRSGTLPTPLCVGFGKACEIARDRRVIDAERLTALRSTLFAGLRAIYPEARQNGGGDAGHPGNLNIAFDGIDASELVGLLQPHVAVSTGSACTSGLPHPSHVLEAIGLSRSTAESSVRFCVGRFTTDDDIVRALEHIAIAMQQVSRNAA